MKLILNCDFFYSRTSQSHVAFMLVTVERGDGVAVHDVRTEVYARLVVPNLMFCLLVKFPLPPGNNAIVVNK